MTMGLTVGNIVELASGASCDIRPAQTSDEWIVHNVYVTYGKEIEVTKTTGTLSTSVRRCTESFNGVFHVTYTQYLHVNNISGSTIYVGYDGIQSA